MFLRATLGQHLKLMGSEESSLNDGATGALIWTVVIAEIILMGSLAIIGVMFLHQSCKKKQQTAGFIIKLLVLVVLVAISGIVNAIHEAPWWKES